MLVVPSTVGVPVGVNPVAPSSISQIVAVPASVHPKSALVVVIFVAVSVVGVIHDSIVVNSYGPAHSL